MEKATIIFSILMLIACAAYKPIVPKQADADRAAKDIPGLTLTDLNEGKAIFEDKCHKCHSLKRPFGKTDVEIADALPGMAKRAKLDSHQQALVLNYLLTMVNVQTAN